jgi:ABC-2 type transport system permease protein
MNRSVVWALILKDWRLQRPAIALSGVVSALSLGMFHFKSEVPFVLGAIWFFVPIIVLGCILPMANVVNERKKQNLAFLMSLPLSAMQYTTSKVVSTFGMFLIPWLTLFAAILMVILRGSVIPHSVIPTVFVLEGSVLVGFCLIAGAAIAGENEGWPLAATLVCNSSYGAGFYLYGRIPEIQQDWQSPVAVWSPIIQRFLIIEVAIVILVIGLTFFIQSRKRDFV